MSGLLDVLAQSGREVRVVILRVVVAKIGRVARLEVWPAELLLLVALFALALVMLAVLVVMLAFVLLLIALVAVIVLMLGKPQRLRRANELRRDGGSSLTRAFDGGERARRWPKAQAQNQGW